MRILVILSRFPFPLEKGDKLRAYYQIRDLAQRHEVHLIALSDQAVSQAQQKELEPYCASITIHRLTKGMILGNLTRAFFKGWPFQVGYFYHPKIQQAITQRIKNLQPDAIFAQLIRTAEYIRGERHIPITLDYMDVFSRGMGRRLETETFPKKWAVNMEYQRLLRYEAEVFDDFGGKTIISDQDRDLIPHPERHKIAVIPNGVDYSYYHPMKLPASYDLLFAGNMAYPPNVESVNFIVKEVMPLIWKERPETTFVIAGATPAPEVKALAGPKVTVTGWVEDIRQYFGGSKIMLAPMLISIGMQNKILQAMAMKIPCVVTPLANNAIGAEPGKAVVVATSPQDFATSVLELLNNPQKAQLIAEEAWQFVRKTYDWEVAGRNLEKIIQQK